MRISMDKTGFLVSDRQVKAAFKQVLQEPEFKKGVYPKVQSRHQFREIEAHKGAARQAHKGPQEGRQTERPAVWKASCSSQEQCFPYCSLWAAYTRVEQDHVA